MTYTVEVINPDGTVAHTLPFVQLEREEKFNEMESARVWVPSPDGQSATLDEDQDEIEVRDADSNVRWRGILTEAKQRADQFELICDGVERYARDAEPSQGVESYSSTTDQTVVQDAVDNVSELSQGNITQQQSGITIDFYYASQALKIREMRDLTNSYPQFNYDKTVDYTSSIGSDKTADGNISPTNLNITDFRVNESEPEPTPTHIRVIGFDGNYVDVVASSFSSGDREIWRRAYYNDIANTTALTEIGNQLIAELNASTTRIEATLIGDDTTSTGLTPKLGDLYHVVYSDYNIDRDITVAKVTEIADTDGTHYEVVFSDRDLTFERDEEFETQSKLKRRFNETESTGGVRTDVSNSGSLVVEEVEDINFDQNLSVTDDGDQTVTVDAVPQLATIPMTELEDGEFISSRIRVPSGETFELWECGVQNESNNAPSGLTAEVDDETNSTNVASVNSKRSTGSPIGSVAGAADIALRTENDTGGTETATSYFKIAIG